MERLIKAWENSIRAFGCLLRSETAFRQELLLLMMAVPAGWFVSTSWRTYLMLLGAILLLIIVEVLNTAIEATCDALSTAFDPQIRLAKDCGSLAVLLAIVLAASIWILALAERFVGFPL